MKSYTLLNIALNGIERTKMVLPSVYIYIYIYKYDKHDFDFIKVDLLTDLDSYNK
jgi:hypothetical protein